MAMDYKIWFCLELFVIEYFNWIILNRQYNLRLNLFQLTISQLSTVAILILHYFLNTTIFELVLMNIFSAFLIVLLITNDYKFSKIFGIFLNFVVYSFSIYGYYRFLLLIFKSLKIINLSSEIYFDILFAICFVCYYLLLNLSVSLMSKNALVQKNYASVSFSLNQKHITLKGLIDSGNSVYDSESNKPVVIISVNSLKKIIPLATFGYVCDVLASHFEKCVVVGGKNIYIPIVSVSDCKITKQGKTQTTQFVVGVVNQNFYDEKKFDCLIHKSFG